MIGGTPQGFAHGVVHTGAGTYVGAGQTGAATTASVRAPNKFRQQPQPLPLVIAAKTANTRTTYFMAPFLRMNFRVGEWAANAVSRPCRPPHHWLCNPTRRPTMCKRNRGCFASSSVRAAQPVSIIPLATAREFTRPTLGGNCHRYLSPDQVRHAAAKIQGRIILVVPRFAETP